MNTKYYWRANPHVYEYIMEFFLRLIIGKYMYINKYKLLCLAIATVSLCFHEVNAQTTTLCGIWFDYDAAGNRIKRYYDCKAVEEGGNGPGHGPSSQSKLTSVSLLTPKIGEPAVYPNPTDGKFTIRLKEEAKAHFHWYDAKGSILASGNFETSTYEGTIAEFPPGNYTLKIYLNGQTYSYTITKRN